MRRPIAIAIITIMLIQPMMAATDISGLTAEAQMEFMNNSLSIQTEQNTYTYGSVIGNAWSTGLITGTAIGNSTTTTEWKPYMGPVEIDKGRFYEITGQDDLLAEYSKGIEKERTYKIAGWSLLGASLAGGALMSILGLVGGAQHWWRGNADDILVPTLGYGGLLVMLVGGLTSVPLLVWDYNDDVSISFAVGIADMYNQRLAESLR